jgi:hypothetical protein
VVGKRGEGGRCLKYGAGLYSMDEAEWGIPSVGRLT